MTWLLQGSRNDRNEITTITCKMAAICFRSVPVCHVGMTPGCRVRFVAPFIVCFVLVICFHVAAVALVAFLFLCFHLPTSWLEALTQRCYAGMYALDRYCQAFIGLFSARSSIYVDFLLAPEKSKKYRKAGMEMCADMHSFTSCTHPHSDAIWWCVVWLVHSESARRQTGTEITFLSAPRGDDKREHKKWAKFIEDMEEGSSDIVILMMAFAIHLNRNQGNWGAFLVRER